MPYLILLFAIIFSILLFLMFRKNEQLKKASQQLIKMQADAAHNHQTAEQLKTQHHHLLDLAYTIHLYAALSSEDAPNDALKQKQQTIINLSESMIEILSEKQAGDRD